MSVMPDLNVCEKHNTQKRDGKACSHGARVQNCSIFSSQASVSHPSFPIVSVNGHRQSGGHWNVALGLLGSSIGLLSLSAGGWWCVGGRGALSRSGVCGVMVLLAVTCRHRPIRSSAAVALRHQRNKRPWTA
jgi:hypothetical protein